MPKILIYSSLSILILVGLLSVIVNYQKHDDESKSNAITIDRKKSESGINWQSVLNNASQYKSAVKDTEPFSEPQSSIKNMQLVGILLDEPSSALIMLNQATSPEVKEFKIGESWEKNWVIIEILADSVVWKNLVNNSEYKQELFSLTPPPKLLDKRVKNKKKRKK